MTTLQSEFWTNCNLLKIYVETSNNSILKTIRDNFYLSSCGTIYKCWQAALYTHFGDIYYVVLNEDMIIYWSSLWVFLWLHFYF